MMIDSHAHLDFDRFDEDRDELLTRAQEVGVERIISIGTRIESSERALALAERYPHLISASVGFHPLYLGDDHEEGRARLAELASDPRCVAIGETGLDYFYTQRDEQGEERSEASRAALEAAQRASFTRHLKLSAALNKPVIVHIRDAFDDAFAITAQEGLRGEGVVHCFTGGPEDCERALELGYHISLSGVVTFKSARALQAAVPLIPLDRILIETDAPFLAPVPMRGARNEPAFVRYTAERVAELKGLSFEALCEATTENARRLFSLPKSTSKEG